MMEERPAPAWIVAAIRLVQGDQGALGGMMVGASAALALMMAIGILVAWQVGERHPAPGAAPTDATTTAHALHGRAQG